MASSELKVKINNVLGNQRSFISGGTSVLGQDRVLSDRRNTKRVKGVFPGGGYSKRKGETISDS